MKKTMRKYLWVLLANILLVAAIAVIWETKLQAAAPVEPVLKGEFTHVKIKPEPTPLPKATYLQNLEITAELQSLKGEWTILNLWATWCAPCVLELPSLQLLATTFEGKGLKVLAVSIDNAESVTDLKLAMARAKLSKIAIAQHWDDKGELSDTLWPEAVPTTYIINPEGQIFAVFEGDANWMSADAVEFVESLIGKTE